MQTLFSSKARVLFASAAILLWLAPRCLADTIKLKSTAMSALVLDPSSDSITLTAKTDNVTSTDPTVFQTGKFDIGTSSTTDQIIPFSFDDTITLNGVTEVLDIVGQDTVTATGDTLTIFAGTPTLFGDQYFTLQPITATGAAPGKDVSFNLTATVTPTPEPNTFLLIGTGLFVVIFLAALTRRPMGRSGSAGGMDNMIKMPVRTPTWVQRGATFHSAAPGAVVAAAAGGAPSLADAPIKLGPTAVTRVAAPKPGMDDGGYKA